MAEVVKNNLTQTQGTKLNFYPPMIKYGIKVVQLNQQEIDKQKKKWQGAVIGYVIGGTPKIQGNASVCIWGLAFCDNS